MLGELLVRLNDFSPNDEEWESITEGISWKINQAMNEGKPLSFSAPFIKKTPDQEGLMSLKEAGKILGISRGGVRLRLLKMGVTHIYVSPEELDQLIQNPSRRGQPRKDRSNNI